jgi:hypothetical protein
MQTEALASLGAKTFLGQIPAVPAEEPVSLGSRSSTVDFGVWLSLGGPWRTALVIVKPETPSTAEAFWTRKIPQHTRRQTIVEARRARRRRAPRLPDTIEEFLRRQQWIVDRIALHEIEVELQSRNRDLQPNTATPAATWISTVATSIGGGARATSRTISC